MAKKKEQEAQPDPDQQILEGGPGHNETPAPVEDVEPAQPAGAPVKIGGREFAVDQDLAEALSEREKAFDQKLSAQGEELGQLRKIKQQVDALNAPAQASAQQDSDTLMFENPSAWREQLKDELRQELESKYQQAEKQKDWWREFHDRHKDIPASKRWIVGAVATKYATTLNAINDPIELSDKVADLTRREILDLTPADNDKPSRAVMEGASGAKAKKAEKKEEEGGTLTDYLKARKRARRASPTSKE